MSTTILQDQPARLDRPPSAVEALREIADAMEHEPLPAPSCVTLAGGGAWIFTSPATAMAWIAVMDVWDENAYETAAGEHVHHVAKGKLPSGFAIELSWLTKVSDHAECPRCGAPEAVGR